MVDPDRLIELFDLARSLAAGADRDRLLAERCGGDPGLMEQVVSLLRAHDDAGDFLEGTPASPPERGSEGPGDRIGRYKLVRKIGEGGCGVVYLAEQEEPVRRQVALKVIKLGMDTEQVIARFEAERQALALMDHPNIARVLDAGATGEGRPYFVMELVDGTRITDYCDQNGLSTTDRLGLFFQVCQAIQHAHQKGIIHRDIKPSNVLVTHLDGAAVPKVIDFGIAKATANQRLTDRTLFTAFDQFIGTPIYMSPEQARGSGGDIDTRTDIYSLGILLYELLTGNLPFDPEELAASGLEGIRRYVSERETPRPSTRLSELDRADLSAVAEHRGTEPPRLIHLIQGDLDWIALRCLEKDRGRRYQTASDVAMDLQRHRKGEPVLACPPSTAYRFGKFARRHKAALAAAGAFGLAVLLAMVGLAVSNRLITGERIRADENLARAREAVKGYLLKVMDDPRLEAGDFQVLRRELLESAIPFYEEFLRQDRQSFEIEFERGRALDDLGYLKESLGDREGALKDLLESRAIFARLSDRHPDRPACRLRLAESHNSLGGVLDGLGRRAEAEDEYRRGLAIAGELAPVPGEPSGHLEALGRLQGNLGLLLAETGRPADAESLLRGSISAREDLLRERPDSLALRGQVAHSWNNLGIILRGRRAPAEAEIAFRKVLEILDLDESKRAESGSEAGKVQRQRIQAWTNLGMTLTDSGRIAEAEQALRRSTEIGETLAGKHPSVPQYRRSLAAGYNNLGTILESMDKPGEAQEAYEKSAGLYERLAAGAPSASADPIALAGTWANLGRLLRARGQAEKSLSWLDRGVRMLEDALSQDGRVTKVRQSLLVARWARAQTLEDLGRHADARDDWDRALEMDDGRRRERILVNRASCRLRSKDPDGALADADRAIGSPDVSAEILYDTACIHAVAAGLVPGDPDLAESRAARAVGLLRRARSAGFEDRTHMEADPDLDALRSRRDFRSFLEELPAGSPPRKDGSPPDRS